MKDIKDVISEKLIINKNTKINKSFETIEDLAEALLKRFEGYGEFENIVDDHTFYAGMEDNYEDINFWKKRIKKYKGLFDNYQEEKSSCGIGEITWTWNLDDFNEDYDILYKNICELFDFFT